MYYWKNKKYCPCSTCLWTACADTKRNCKHHKTRQDKLHVLGFCVITSQEQVMRNALHVVDAI